MGQPHGIAAKRGNDVDVEIAVVVGAERDCEPSGEKRGNSSSPGADVKRVARPPVLGTTQMSPAYTKAMWVAETSG